MVRGFCSLGEFGCAEGLFMSIGMLLWKPVSISVISGHSKLKKYDIVRFLDWCCTFLGYSLHAGTWGTTVVVILQIYERECGERFQGMYSEATRDSLALRLRPFSTYTKVLGPTISASMFDGQILWWLQPIFADALAAHPRQQGDATVATYS